MYRFVKFPPILLIAITAMIGFSCSSDDDDDPVVADTTIATDFSEVNQKFEDLDNLTLEILEESGLGARKTQTNTPDFCASTEFEMDEANKTILIDFGDGCVSPKGVSRKGKIMIKYSGNLLIPGANIVTTFDGYEVNGFKVEGTRTLTNIGLDILSSTVTIAVKIENGKITWPDGEFVTISANEVREVKLGSSGYDASITGTASGNSRDGSGYTAEITEPLKLTQSCIESGVYNPVSGLIEFTYKSVKMTLDYGTGSCDKSATVSYPGGVKEITFD
ncbi:hypothetical protein JYB64_20390 [Algoriphagus aestuarii]|nr:hypothetical protein [Algoriphagus aestuarii]